MLRFGNQNIRVLLQNTDVHVLLPLCIIELHAGQIDHGFLLLLRTEPNFFNIMLVDVLEVAWHCSCCMTAHFIARAGARRRGEDR